MRVRLCVLGLVFAGLGVTARGAAGPPAPAPPAAASVTIAAAPDAALLRAADDLLAADRAFSASGATTNVVTALTAMFRPDVIVPQPTGLVRGIDAARAALEASPENREGRATWTPIRAGVSADGQHGFTFGFMTVRLAEGKESALKYMAYWVRQPEGWRVAGYKRARRGAGEVSVTPMAPHVPARAMPVVTDAARLAAGRQSLVDAEQEFSDAAAKVGLGPAFVSHGAPTAVNMGGPDHAAYVVGNDAIGALVGEGAPGVPSPVVWSSETAVVAPSGDLGISFGYIRPRAAGGAPPAGPGRPFFTIWVRESPAAPWRYIAE
ncbi:MAG: DUF4440 domain-containing protein [Vicinamibacterales bacterium]